MSSIQFAGWGFDFQNFIFWVVVSLVFATVMTLLIRYLRKAGK